MSNDIVNDILTCLNVQTLTKIKNKCDSYISYCVDYKQANDRFGIRTRQKEILELLEMVQTTIVLKQFESDKSANSANSCENITSTLNTEVNVESKKKEKKSK